MEHSDRGLYVTNQVQLWIMNDGQLIRKARTAAQGGVPEMTDYLTRTIKHAAVSSAPWHVGQELAANDYDRVDWESIARKLLERDELSPPSDYVCVYRPQCKHYPHTFIPRGEEEWVRSGNDGRGNQISHHKDCVAGYHYVSRDGKRVSPYYVEENGAWMWLQKHVGYSVDHATKYEGYKFETAE